MCLEELTMGLEEVGDGVILLPTDKGRRNSRLRGPSRQKYSPHCGVNDCFVLSIVARESQRKSLQWLVLQVWPCPGVADQLNRVESHPLSRTLAFPTVTCAYGTVLLASAASAPASSGVSFLLTRKACLQLRFSVPRKLLLELQSWLQPG